MERERERERERGRERGRGSGSITTGVPTTHDHFRPKHNEWLAIADGEKGGLERDTRQDKQRETSPLAESVVSCVIYGQE